MVSFTIDPGVSEMYSLFCIWDSTIWMFLSGLLKLRLYETTGDENPSSFDSDFIEISANCFDNWDLTSNYLWRFESLALRSDFYLSSSKILSSYSLIWIWYYRTSSSDPLETLKSLISFLSFIFSSWRTLIISPWP